LLEGGAQAQQCALCSLPVGRSGIQDAAGENTLHFCCPGCLAVFRILSNRPEGAPDNFRHTELYQACVASGIIPGNAGPGLEGETDALKGVQDSLSSPSGTYDNLAEEMNLRIEGMWCPSCAWVIEALLGKMSGVLDARVFFLSDLATIRYLPHRTSTQKILSAISGLGYHAATWEDRAEPSREKKRLFLRLGISSILTVNIMMISFALYAGFFQELGADAVRYFSYPLWILATPVVFYGGFPILKRAWAGLRSLSFSMDTLIAAGALSAYLYSVVMMTEASLHLYFDTSAMLVTLVLLGRYIEKEAREKASRGIPELCNAAAGKVRLFEEGSETWRSAAKITPGDKFLVLGGERVPVDGTIISGRANVDESILTGESRPVGKSPGDEVLAGSLALDGQLLLRATRTAAESSLGQIAALVHRALNHKAPAELLADRVVLWLAPIILLLAAATVTCLRLQGVALDQALLRGLTVLVITCPCALGIATPLAKVAAIGMARTMGMAIQNAEVFEKARGLDTLLFDKTGTITEGKFLLTEVFSGPIAKTEALQRVASIEALSDHFLAREIARSARDLCLELEEIIDFEAFAGLGVRGRIRSGEVWVGNRRFMENQGLALTPSVNESANLIETTGMTVVFFGWDHEVMGFFTFGDPLREEARHVVAELQAKGFELWLVSGDSLATTQSIAQESGIPNFLGQALPQDKMELVRKLQERGRRVGMVGDGLNDALALALADTGIAFGSTANLIPDASDLTILQKDLNKIPEIFRLSTLTTKVIGENLFFAFLYNLVGIPLAVGGILNPLIAVFAMFASSLTVIGNTLRITRSTNAKIA
jgi:heavy metal translocating P-type ATPase